MGSCNGYGFYLSQYTVNWVNRNTGKYQICVIMKARNGKVRKICRFR